MSLKIATDKKLNRLAIVCNIAPAYRVWLVMRSESGSGQINKKELRAILSEHHIIKSKRNYDHILKTGEGILWTVQPNGIYFKSFVKVATDLTRRAYIIDAHTATANRVGVTRHEITINRNKGNLTDFKASCLALWLDDKQISQLETARMFNISEVTVRAWAHRSGVKITANYIEMPLTHGTQENPHVTHGYLIKNKQGKTVISQRISNSYKYYRSKERYRGSGYQARKDVNSNLSKLDSNAILSNCDTLYIQTFKELQNAERQGHFNGDSFRYFCTGHRKLKRTKGKIGIFELCLHGITTAPIDNRDYKAEHDPKFIEAREQHNANFKKYAII